MNDLSRRLSRLEAAPPAPNPYAGWSNSHRMLRAMELIGYDTPEPGGMLLVAISGLSALGRRKTRISQGSVQRGGFVGDAPPISTSNAPIDR